jgi:HSP20 family protein
VAPPSSAGGQPPPCGRRPGSTRERGDSGADLEDARIAGGRSAAARDEQEEDAMETRTLVPTLGRRMLAPLANLREEMDKLFNDWLAAADFEPLRVFEGYGEGFLPRLDVVEREKALEIVVELPGVEQKDIEIELTKNTLILKGQKKVELEEKEEGYFRRERRYGTFMREIALPWEVDPAKVSAEATFVNGVLTVKVPKPKEVLQATRKVAILP